MAIDPDSPATRRAIAGAAVALLHVLALLGLAATGHAPAALRAVLPARLILDAARPPPPPPPIPAPTLAAPPALFVPAPQISVATPPPSPASPRAITRAPAAAPTSHFGAATEAGLGLDLATSSGGGAGARGTLAGFEAEVRRRVLAARRQPTLAWDRRDTCVVEYSLRVAPGGALAGFTIAPCGVPEINEAARDAIRRAAPYPAPPDLGAAGIEVHGTLVFRP
jgi:protein TonB